MYGVLSWNDAEDALIKKGLAKGMSAQEIATSINMHGKNHRSRNSILGRIHRLGLNKCGAVPKRKEPEKSKITPVRFITRSKKTIPRKYGVKVDTPSDNALRLNDPWPAHACRFPMFDGEITPTTPLFCGERAEKYPFTYCNKHRSSMYYKIERKKRGEK